MKVLIKMLLVVHQCLKKIPKVLNEDSQQTDVNALLADRDLPEKF